MNYFNWLDQELKLTAGALTVRAQAVPVNDNGRLKWPIFFPRKDVASVDLHEITTITFRPTAERREWNGPSKKIVMKTPNLRDLSIIPVEGAHTIEEYELQKIAERRINPNSDMFRQILGADIPDRVVFLTNANYRRIEYDAFQTWALGTIVVRNPVQSGSSYTVSYGFDPTRYATASPDWATATNAFDAFMTWLRDTALNLVGPVQGALMRQTTLNEIVKDAPNPYSLNASVLPTISQVEARVQDLLGTDFRFIVNEDTVDLFSGGGQATTKTKVWPTGRVAAIPAGNGQIGDTCFAPVFRAMQIAGIEPTAPIDINGMTAYREVANGGRELKIEVQCNPLTVPNEQNVAVINAGV